MVYTPLMEKTRSRKGKNSERNFLQAMRIENHVGKPEKTIRTIIEFRGLYGIRSKERYAFVWQMHDASNQKGEIMITEKNITTKIQPDEIFPCLRCATTKKSGHSVFWRWPDSEQFFCDHCVPHPGLNQCEIFGIGLNENFQWVVEILSSHRSPDPPKENHACDVTPPELRDWPPLEDEYMRCMACQRLVSQFDIFDHPCHPASWKA